MWLLKKQCSTYEINDFKAGVVKKAWDMFALQLRIRNLKN